MRAIALALTTCLSCATQSAFAQHDQSEHRLPQVPSALLTRPLPLRKGIGVAHDTVATSSDEAQRYYDQGLTYLHHYAWVEAARSFNQALRLDATLAPAYIGLSLASTGLNQRTAARTALGQARTLAPRGAHEQQHLIVRERQMEAEERPGDPLRMAAYRQSIDAALTIFPKDAELWLQRGIAESADAGDRGQGSPGSAVRFYTKVLEIVPDHFAAHHYLTHAFENGGQIESALSHGAAYARLAPEIPHARHMHAHDLRRMGRIGEAIAEFEAADRIEAAYFSAERVPPEIDWHHEHNLDLLGTSYQYTGQLRRASALLEKAFNLPTNNLVQAVNKRQWPAFLRAQGRNEPAVAAARVLGRHPHPVVQAIARVEAAHALLSLQRHAEAAAEINAAAAALRSAPAGAGLAATAMRLVQGEFFLRTGQRDRGRQMLRTGLAEARRLPGPDEWTQALFTLEAAARGARAAGDWDLAGSVAADMLAHDPSYAGAHYEMALVAEHNNDRGRASREFEMARLLWSDADEDLPALVEIRKRRAGTSQAP